MEIEDETKEIIMSEIQNLRNYKKFSFLKLIDDDDSNFCKYNKKDVAISLILLLKFFNYSYKF